jgi:hypothetical protein
MGYIIFIVNLLYQLISSLQISHDRFYEYLLNPIGGLPFMVILGVS